MGSFLRKLCSVKLLPVIWTLITIVLLCLPGDSIAGNGPMFEIPNFDKVVHILLFGGIAYFWGMHYAFRPGTRDWRKLSILLAGLSIGLGIVLEFVQLFWIPDRSFDVFDILADSVGAVIAVLLLLYLYPGKRVKS
jgi:hypothetical protein